LWFWGKTGAERSALLRKKSKIYELEALNKEMETKVAILKSKVLNQLELLKIFKSSLIPQAQSSYEGSVNAYRANRVKFLSLLDSERSLFKVQIAYYRSLTQFIEGLTQLESALGYKVSNLN
jgi:outer membrane protein, heavy metal efflux system